MINISNPDYFEEVTVLRAVQAWKQESLSERAISQSYQLFLEQIKRELSDLYAQFGVEGLLDYSTLRRRLTPTQLAQYRAVIQDLINQNRDIQDEELLLGLTKLAEYRNLTVMDSRIGIIEAYLIVLTSKNLEMVSESLSQTYEYVHNHSLYDIHRKMGMALPFEKLNPDSIRNAIVSDWSGDTFIDAIKHTRHNLIRDVKKSIIKGIRRNETYGKLVRELDKLVSGGKGYKSIRNILRTESTRVITEATAKTYEQSGIRKYMHVSTLDNRTTELCRTRDGQVYDLEELEIGVTAPPLHYYCRSIITAVITDFDSNRQRIARSPETGQNYKVPANLSYKEWDEQYNR